MIAIPSRLPTVALKSAPASSPPDARVKATPLVTDLLADCPRVKVLVTSRAALQVRGEREVAVRPLPLPARTYPPDPAALMQNAAVALRKPEAVALEDMPFGPSEPSVELSSPVSTDWSQFQRTAIDVSSFLRKQHRIPSAVWLGSVPVPPESYLVALAEVVRDQLAGKPKPETVTLRPARLAVGKYVADDSPRLWT